MKTCTKCGVEKPLADFTRDRKTQDGHSFRCKDCQHSDYIALREKLEENYRQKIAPDTKACTKCGKTLPFHLFSLNKRSSDGRESQCITCRYAMKAAARKRRWQNKRHEYDLLSDVKKCKVCGQLRPLIQFYQKRYAKDGRDDRCIACEKVRQEEYKKQNAERIQQYHLNYKEVNRDRIREGFLQKLYGITLKEYMAIFNAQNGFCAICQQPETAKTNGTTGKRRMLCVDHDHLTGQIRGLLCSKCNTAIGQLDDDPERMVRAMHYLEQAVQQRKVVQLELFGVTDDSVVSESKEQQH